MATRTRLRIAEMARERHWSMNELSRRSGVDGNTLIRYWRNTAKRLDISVLERFADAFGVSVKELIAETDKKL
jgi:transcriptional regulator with XRE-family HTH domain